MPRIKSTELQLRDGEIIASARRNVPRRDIAEKYGITEQRVSQIVTQNLDPKFPDTDLRAWLLEGYFGDLQRLQEIKEGPGRAVTSGKGDHVRDGNTGEFAYDTSPVADAIRTAAGIRKNIAVLVGNEKPVPKPIDEGMPLQEQVAYVREITIENRSMRDEISSLKAEMRLLKDQLSGKIVEAEVVE